jgi:hypothetical protein
MVPFIPQFQPIMDKKEWQLSKAKQIQLQPEDKLEAEHAIVEKHGTVSPIVMNENDKVLLSPDESSDVLRDNNRVTMSPVNENRSNENKKVIIGVSSKFDT